MTTSNQNSADTLPSRIPGYVLEDYPRFYEFLEAYYEWLNLPGNAYERVKNHMDYLNFERSLADYVDSLKAEFLVDVPESALLDKELFIKWSKKFNLSRGSKASYKFIFRILFGETSTDIYRPKDNILRASDGTWISGENSLIVTRSQDPKAFIYKRIVQKRVLYKDVVEYAYATVERINSKYSGRYFLSELIVRDIEGEFKEGWPIETEEGAQEWIVPTVSRVIVTNGGSGYVEGQRVNFSGFSTFDVVGKVEESGKFDTKITTRMLPSDIEVEVNGSQLSGFSFDGRYVVDESLIVGANVKVILPTYEGYAVVDRVDQNGKVESVEILDTAIGRPSTSASITSSGLGSGLTGTLQGGYIKPIKGYFKDYRGHLSSIMYLQDSYFYQDYSYAIKTEQTLSKYQDIVLNLLHPAGFEMFGEINIIMYLKYLLRYHFEYDFVPYNVEFLPKYAMGMNYAYFDKMKYGLSKRLWKISYFDKFDMQFFVGEDGYNKESYRLANVIPTYTDPGLKGWMESMNFSDFSVYIPQNYAYEYDGGDLLFEENIANMTFGTLYMVTEDGDTLTDEVDVPFVTESDYTPIYPLEDTFIVTTEGGEELTSEGGQVIVTENSIGSQTN